MSTLQASDIDTLKELARTALQHFLTHEALPEIDPSTLPERLHQTHNIFVTLNKNEQLRGCIGTMSAEHPLYETVMAYAVHAALNDHRFPPVTLGELPSIDIDVSVLLPPYSVNSYEDIQLGKHGILLEKNGRSALFLPQVPIEWEWDLPTTLTQLALKAGLQGSDWQEDCQFSVFEKL